MRFENFAPLIRGLAEKPGSIELLVIGTGEKMARLPAPLAQNCAATGLAAGNDGDGAGGARLQRAGVGENRRVAALLLAAP